MSNKIKSYIWGILFATIIISLSPSKAYAFVTLAIDPKSIILNIKNYFTKVMESETVVKTIKTVKKTSAAIGTAKKTVTEYVTENKKKIEAQIEMIKQYKEQAELYKAQYDEYRAKIDEGIATAKKYKEDIENTIDTAKSTVETVKDTINNAPELLGDIKEQVKSQIDDKLSDVTDKIEGALPKEIADKAKDLVPETLSGDVQDNIMNNKQPSASADNDLSTESLPQGAEISTSSRTSFVGDSNPSNSDSAKGSSSENNVSDGLPQLNNQATTSFNGDTSDINNDNSENNLPSIGDNSLNNTTSQSFATSSNTENNAPTSTRKAFVGDSKASGLEVSDSQVSNSTSVSSLNSTAPLNTSEVRGSLESINQSSGTLSSSAKLLQETPSNTQSATSSKASSSLKSVSSTSSSSEVKSIKQSSGTLSSSAKLLQETPSNVQSVTSSKALTPIQSSPSINDSSKAIQLNQSNNSNDSIVILKSSSSTNIQEGNKNSLQKSSTTSTRKAFTTSSVSRSDNMAFAMALSLPDNGTNVNGTLIVPQAMALSCGISSSTALEKDIVDSCLVWLNEERKKAQVDSPYNAPDVFNQINSTYAAAIMAESYKALNDAEYFEENFVEPIEFAPDNNIQDAYANIIELNKNIDIQMNNLLKIKSTILAAKTIESYYNYGFINYEDPEIIVADNIGKDNGTGADNVFKIPQQMALTCGLDSETVKDVTLVDECFNTLANITEPDGFYLIRDIILHQTNKQALELALKIKSEAGDFEDKQAEVLKDESMGQPESPAVIGTEGEDEGANISAAQEKNAKLAALSANNILTLLDVYSMQMALDVLINFYTYDAPNRKKAES